MDVEQLGVPDRDPIGPDGGSGGPDDPERHDGPRTAVVLAVAALLGLLAVGGVFWIVTAGLGGPGGGAEQVAGGPVAVSTSDTTSTPAQGPTTITSTNTSTSRTTTPAPTLDLPPPEQPTYTLPPTATSAVAATTASAPSPAPTTTTAGAPQVSGATLSCTRSRKATTGVLTFTTTAPVQASLLAGGKAVSGSRGPGAVTLTVSGDGPGYCVAAVGGRTLGPVPAR